MKRVIAKTLFWVGFTILAWLLIGLVLWLCGAPSYPVALAFTFVGTGIIAAGATIFILIGTGLTKLYEWIDEL